MKTRTALAAVPSPSLRLRCWLSRRPRARRGGEGRGHCGRRLVVGRPVLERAGGGDVRAEVVQRVVRRLPRLGYRAFTGCVDVAGPDPCGCADVRVPRVGELRARRDVPEGRVPALDRRQQRWTGASGFVTMRTGQTRPTGPDPALGPCTGAALRRRRSCNPERKWRRIAAMTVAGEHFGTGSELAGYRIVALVGRGGMGEVYRAHDERLDRDVALKVLAPRFGEDEEFRGRLPRVPPGGEPRSPERRAGLRGRRGRRPPLPGDALRRRHGPARRAASTGRARPGARRRDRRAGRGRARCRPRARPRAPGRKAVERADRRPGGREHCYLADFGLTQSLSDRGQPADGHLLGTLDYVAPEQIRGDEVDGRADVYALACVVQECLTGEAPLPRSVGGGDHLRAPAGRPARGERALAPTSGGGRRRAAARPREGSRRAAADGERARGGGARGPRPGPAPSSGAAGRRLRRPTLAALAAIAVAVVVATRGGTPGGRPRPSIARPRARCADRGRAGTPGQPRRLAGRAGSPTSRRRALAARAASGELQRITSAGEPRDLGARERRLRRRRRAEALRRHRLRLRRSHRRTRDAVDLLAVRDRRGDGVVWAAGCPCVDRLSTDGRPFRILHERFLPFAMPTSAENRAVPRALVGAGSPGCRATHSTSACAARRPHGRTAGDGARRLPAAHGWLSVKARSGSQTRSTTPSCASIRPRTACSDGSGGPRRERRGGRRRVGLLGHERPRRDRVPHRSPDAAGRGHDRGRGHAARGRDGAAARSG